MMKMNLQLFAHKKGVGSTKNGRDSESKRLGAKRADGQFVKAGNILYRQRCPLPRGSASAGRGWLCRNKKPCRRQGRTNVHHIERTFVHQR